jgi:Cd2+/Zn2+-exporting ATPase
VAVDKTGTLTRGLFRVVDKLACSPSAAEVETLLFNPLQLAAAVEQKSTHPLANAVVASFCGCLAEAVNIKMPDVKRIKVLDGVGVTGMVLVNGEWKQVTVGNERVLQTNGGSVVLNAEQERKYAAFITAMKNKAVLLVIVENVLHLALALADELRPESTDFVSTIQHMGMKVTMLTGDQEQVAKDVCQVVGISADDCHARLLPNQKLEWIQNAQKVQQENSSKKSDHVLMIGDGINDSTALASATVGVAMGAGGTAMAVASADVILMTDNLQLIPACIRLCSLTRSIIFQSCSFAIAIKIAAIVVALLGRLQFWQAILIDLGSLLVVVGNGTRPLWSSANLK